MIHFCSPHITKKLLKPFKCVEINCDLGPVTVHVEAANKNAMEFHQSMLKFIEVDYRGDTLIIHTLKTPKSTPESPIYKQIYIYSSNISYYKAVATESVILNFKEKRLDVKSYSSSVRINSCVIDNLNLQTNYLCTYLIDSQNHFQNVYASISPNSSFACYGYVDKLLTLRCENLKQMHFKEHVRQLKIEKW